MLEAGLTAESALQPSEEAVDEPQDHHATSEQAGVYIYSPVDAGPGTTPSGEHRASIRVARQSAGTGLVGDGDPGLGPRPASIGGTDEGWRGLQDRRRGGLTGESGREVRPEGL